MKIMILGAGGFLGTKLVSILSKDNEVFPYYHKEKKPSLDITSSKDIDKEMIRIKPDVVIHSAAITNVDLCETDKELAKKVNIKGTENIAHSCKKINIKLIYISTDFVFDGEKGNYSEEDKKNPISYYGLTKSKAEDIVMSVCKDYLILRVAILYGFNGNTTERSFVNWAYSSLKEGKRINVFDDQIGTPTLIDDVTGAISILVVDDSKGIFHVAGSEKLSRYDMALKIADEFGFDSRLVVPVKTGFLNQPAKRPKDSSLSIEKIKKKGIRMNSFEGGLKIMKKNMKEMMSS